VRVRRSRPLSLLQSWRLKHAGHPGEEVADRIARQFNTPHPARQRPSSRRVLALALTGSRRPWNPPQLFLGRKSRAASVHVRDASGLLAPGQGRVIWLPADCSPKLFCTTTVAPPWTDAGGMALICPKARESYTTVAGMPFTKTWSFG
jgi:hypothetical protein